MGKHLILGGSSFDPNEHKLHEGDLESFVGKTGTTLTQLRPAGAVSVGRRRLDAMSRGEQIDRGVEVEILSIEMSQVVVRKKPVAGTADAEKQEQEQEQDR